MKTVREVMTTDVIRVGPMNKIKTAIILMKGHNIGGLPVMDVDRVLGIVDYQNILGKDNDIPVQNVMDKEFVTIPPDMTVTDAADLMAKINSSRLLVMEDCQLVGVITRGDLLPELGKSCDPITGLPRADALRDWGISALKSGREVTLIFIDLDKFGQYNKIHGHIIGDRILQHVTNVVKQFVDEERELLCRYAGDEFVIVTERYADEAEQLGQAIELAISSTPNPEIPEGVTVSIGIFGGKRTKEREDTHYNATLDNLINLASKACTLAKFNKFESEMEAQLAGQPLIHDGAAAEIAVEPQDLEAIDTEPEFAIEDESSLRPVSMISTAPFSQRRLRLHSLNFSWDGTSMATAEVVLANGEQVSKHAQSGFAMGNNALRLVADATAQAVCAFLPGPGYGVVTESVQVIHAGNGVNIVLTTALFFTPQSQTQVSGSCLIKNDAYRSVSAAFLNAVNRQLCSLLA